MRKHKTFSVRSYSTLQDLLIDFAQKYSDEFGTSKFNNIYGKVSKSKKVERLIKNAERKNLVPNQKDYLHCLNEIPYFIFSKAETLALGGLFAMAKWNDECNQVNQLANDQQMLQIGLGIISECGEIKMNL